MTSPGARHAGEDRAGANRNERRLRRLTTTLGALNLGLGVLFALAPRRASHLFGLDVGPEPTGPVMARATGLRDIVIDAGLIAAAQRGGGFAPWLLARTLSDAGDVLVLLLAVRAGARGPRTLGLTALTLAHTVCDGLLWRSVRRAAVPPS